MEHAKKPWELHVETNNNATRGFRSGRPPLRCQGTCPSFPPEDVEDHWGAMMVQTVQIDKKISPNASKPRESM